MVQEIITYFIVAVAVIIAAKLLYNNLSVPRKKKSRNGAFRNGVMSGKCYDCSADCILRNTVPEHRNPEDSCSIRPQ